jgi:hypothetical protein
LSPLPPFLQEWKKVKACWRNLIVIVGVNPKNEVEHGLYATFKTEGQEESDDNIILRPVHKTVATAWAAEFSRWAPKYDNEKFGVLYNLHKNLCTGAQLEPKFQNGWVVDQDPPNNILYEAPKPKPTEATAKKRKSTALCDPVDLAGVYALPEAASVEAASVAPAAAVPAAAAPAVAAPAKWTPGGQPAAGGGFFMPPGTCLISEEYLHMLQETYWRVQLGKR